MEWTSSWQLWLRATSHMTLKVHGHCILRPLVGRKGRDCPSSFHTRWWRPKSPKKWSWMRRSHEFLHGKQWTMFHVLLKFVSRPPPKDSPDANSCKPCQWYNLWMRIKNPHTYTTATLGSRVKVALRWSNTWVPKWYGKGSRLHLMRLVPCCGNERVVHQELSNHYL